jgi:nitrate/TMAO reductase-like tetraheme cytochrome c subunit
MKAWTLGLPLLLVLLFAAGWGVSDHLERRNDFCNACHLPDGVALHTLNREHFDRVIPISLAGVHGRGWVEERADDAFRCIDCHAGSGAVERARVKLLAARDGLRYAVGAFEEPDGMPFSLSPATCLGCHPTFRHSAAPGWTVEAYHGRPEHDGPEAPVCVRCHKVHDTDGDAFGYFMSRDRVDAACRECHVPGGSSEIRSLTANSRSPGS